jgi:hypothetical protein
MATRSLKTQSDISRALAHVYREVDADRIEPAKARVLIYCALSLSQVLTEHDLEARLVALETAANLRRTA